MNVQKSAITMSNNGISEKSFGSTYHKFTLFFTNPRIESEYREDTYERNLFSLRNVMLCIACFQLIIFLTMFFAHGKTEVYSSVSAALHIIGYFVIKKLRNRCVEFIIAFFSLLNQVSFDLLLTTLSQVNDSYIYIGEFFTSAIACMFFRTRIFMLDCALIITTRLIHLFFLASIYTKDNNSYQIIPLVISIITQKSFIFKTMSIILTLFFGPLRLVVTMLFYLYRSEKTGRGRYIMRQNNLNWIQLIETVLPVNVIISKFNKRTCEIILGSCNASCARLFKIRDNDSYNQMLCKMKIGQVENESMGSLRDYVLNKHFDHVEAKRNSNLEKDKEKDNSVANQSINDIDQHVKMLMGINFASIKKKLQNFEAPEFVGSEIRPFSQKSLNYLGTFPGQTTGVECLTGFLRDRENSVSKRYEIKIFTLSEGSQTTLVLSFEDKSFKYNLQTQKNRNSEIQQVFDKTLSHFQTIVKRAINGISEVSSKHIPIQILYNTLLLNMQINNIQDYLQTGKNNSSSSANQVSMTNIQDLYGGTRFSSKKPQLQMQTLNLGQFLRQIDKLMQKVCETKGIRFALLNEASDEEVLITDKNRLYRVLINYISNSIAATSKGYVQLKVVQSFNLGIATIKFEIIDSGCGFKDGRVSFTSQKAQVTNLNISDQRKQDNHSEDLTSIHGQKMTSYSRAINNQQPPTILTPSRGKHRHQTANIFTSFNSNQVSRSSNEGKDIIQQMESSLNNQQNTLNMETSKNSQHEISTGLGIGMNISKQLISQLGPSYPRVFSEIGVGTNITFEVYQDLKVTLNQHGISNGNSIGGKELRSISRLPTQIQGVNSNNNSPNGIFSQLRKGKTQSLSQFHSGLSSQINLVNQPIPKHNSSPKAYAYQASQSIPQLPSSHQISLQHYSSMQISNDEAQQGSQHQMLDSPLTQRLSEIKNRLAQITVNHNPSNSIRTSTRLIQHDGPENVGEEVQEVLDLGGNCYKMMPSEDDLKPTFSRGKSYRSKKSSLEQFSVNSLGNPSFGRIYNGQIEGNEDYGIHSHINIDEQYPSDKSGFQYDQPPRLIANNQHQLSQKQSWNKSLTDRIVTQRSLQSLNKIGAQKDSDPFLRDRDSIPLTMNSKSITSIASHDTRIAKSNVTHQRNKQSTSSSPDQLDHPVTSKSDMLSLSFTNTLKKENSNKQEYLNNLVQQPISMFHSHSDGETRGNLNLDSYQTPQKNKNESSFCMIFDSRSQSYQVEDPDSIIGNRRSHSGVNNSMLKDSVSEQDHLLFLQPGNGLQYDQISQKSQVSQFTTHSKQEAEEYGISKYQSLNQLKNLQLRDYALSNTVIEYKHRRSSTPITTPVQQTSQHFTQFKVQVPPDSSNSSGSETLNILGGDQLSSLLFSQPSREKSISIKLYLRGDQQTSILQKEKEHTTSGNNQVPADNRGYTISIGSPEKKIRKYEN